MRRLTCAAPGCTNTFEVASVRGRPQIYCTPSCRPSRVPARRAHHHKLTVEVNHPETSPNGRPAGRVWQVTLRRGPTVVTIADDLGWPSAQALAQQLDAILWPGDQTSRSTID